MDSIRNKRMKPVLLLLAVLLLRAAIPVGFMPAAAGSGLFVVFCPDGVSPEFMQFLAGDAGADHDHMEHGNPGENTHLCPIGHMLLSAAATDDGAQTADAAIALPPATSASYFFTSVSRTHYHSRGPPA